MEFIVTDACVGCGMCNSMCPQVFEMTDEGVAHAVEGDAPQAVEAVAREAMESCPVSAIKEK